MSKILWTPTHPETTQWFKFRTYVEQHELLKFPTDEDFQTWAREEFPKFWGHIAAFFHLPFHKPASAVFKKTGPELWQNEWFAHARFNVTDLMLNHPSKHTALVCIQESGERRSYTYGDLRHEVQRCAQALAEAGIRTGDRIIGVLPNNAAAVIAMLASAYLGAIWSACSPDFGDQALLDRFDALAPSALFICEASTYQGRVHRMEDKIQLLTEQLPSLKKVIIHSSDDAASAPLIHPKHISWEAFLHQVKPRSHPAESLPFSHPWVILFSSGTTGKPKCIIHGAGNTILQHLKELGLHCDLREQDTLLFYTTCGWMMWNWMVSGLTLGLKLVLYDGSPMFPNQARIWSMVDQERITALGISPKYLASLEQSGYQPRQHHQLNSLRLMLSTGAPLLPSQYDFVYKHIHPRVHLSSISGGTDIISCFALSHPLKPVQRGYLQTKGLGMHVQILNSKGAACIDEKGELVCSNPFPSMPLGFWKDENDSRYQAAYFKANPGHWTHGDYAEETADHSMIIYGRSDTTLNRGGIRIGSAEIYRVVETIPGIQESLVISQDLAQDSRIILFVKLDGDHHPLTQSMKTLLKQKLRQHASPRHVPDLILEVPDIPKTINGKIVEQAVKNLIQGQPITNLSSIINPECLSYFSDHPDLKTSPSNEINRIPAQ